VLLGRGASTRAGGHAAAAAAAGVATAARHTTEVVACAPHPDTGVFTCAAVPVDAATGEPTPGEPRVLFDARDVRAALDRLQPDFPPP